MGERFGHTLINRESSRGVMSYSGIKVLRRHLLVQLILAAYENVASMILVLDFIATSEK